MNGRVAALSAVVIWGLQFAVLAAAVAKVDAYHFNSVRFLLAAAVLALLLRVREGRAALRFDGRLGAVIGYGTAGFTGFSILLVVAVGLTEPQNAALVVSTAPIVTQLLRWALDGVRPHPAVIGLALVAMAGLTLVITKGHLDGFAAFGLGDLLTFAAVIGWSLYTYGAGRFPGWSPLRFTTLTMIGGAATTVAVTAVADLTGLVTLPTPAGLLAAAPELLYVTVLGSVVAALVWTIAVRTLGASTTVLYLNLPPIIALLVAVAQGARLSPVELAGAALTVAALVAANVVNGRAAKRAAAATATRTVSLPAGSPS